MAKKTVVQQYLSADADDDPNRNEAGRIIYTNRSQCFTADRVGPGDTYWHRTVTYGPWTKGTR